MHTLTCITVAHTWA